MPNQIYSITSFLFPVVVELLFGNGRCISMSPPLSNYNRLPVLNHSNLTTTISKNSVVVVIQVYMNTNIVKCVWHEPFSRRFLNIVIRWWVHFFRGKLAHVLILSNVLLFTFSVKKWGYNIIDKRSIKLYITWEIKR